MQEKCPEILSPELTVFTEEPSIWGCLFALFARKWVFSSLKITVVQKEPSICGCKIFRKPLTLTEREGLCWFRQGEMSDLAKKWKRRCWE